MGQHVLTHAAEKNPFQFAQPAAAHDNQVVFSLQAGFNNSIRRLADSNHRLHTDGLRYLSSKIRQQLFAFVLDLNGNIPAGADLYK